MRIAHFILLVRRRVASLRADTRGVTPMEYALMATFSVMVAITAVVSLRADLDIPFNQIANILQTASATSTSVKCGPHAPPPAAH
jgi:Flp pilus assembly pilin Flp